MSGTAKILQGMTPEQIRYIDDLEKKTKSLQTTVDGLTTFPGFASQSDAEAGTNNTLAMNPLRTAQAIAALGAFQKFIHVQDQRSSGTDGGTFTSGSFQTRTLNTVVLNTITGASLASNQVTLPAGTYYARATAPANRVNKHKVRIQDVTNAVTLLLGGNMATPPVSTSEHTARAEAEGVFTLAASAAIELQHRSQDTVNTNGFGIASSFGVNEVYADLFIARIG